MQSPDTVCQMMPVIPTLLQQSSLFIVKSAKVDTPRPITVNETWGAMGWPVRDDDMFNLRNIFDKMVLGQKKLVVGNGLHVKVAGVSLLYFLALTQMKADKEIDECLAAQHILPEAEGAYRHARFHDEGPIDVDDSQPAETLTLDCF